MISDRGAKRSFIVTRERSFISTLAEDPRSPSGERRMGKPINLAVLQIIC
ncbi:MAG: hypothetical protein F6K24_22310 [Okeania sp. SIO2D1]|nr:hypothetical protein [Okeania sp. SIO2D1]